MSDKPKEEASPKEPKGKRTSIPLRLIPNEAEEIAKEMQDIFDEDKVTHRQGSSEPERD